LDFGCGGGLVALAAKHAGARSVLAVDCDALALAACALNARDHDLELEVAHANTLDAVGACDVVLAGDVFYDRAAGPAVIHDLRARARAGALVLAGCPGRVLTPSLSEDAEIVFECTVPGVLELEGRESRIARVFRLAH
jgi:predicted nicotinamide N-methyase